MTKKTKATKPPDMVEFRVCVDLDHVKQAALKVHGEEWSSAQCRKWMTKGRGFLQRAHERNVPDVVKMVMAFMAAKKVMKPKVAAPPRKRLWRPGDR